MTYCLVVRFTDDEEEEGTYASSTGFGTVCLKRRFSRQRGFSIIFRFLMVSSGFSGVRFVLTCHRASKGKKWKIRSAVILRRWEILNGGFSVGPIPYNYNSSRENKYHMQSGVMSE